MKIEILCCWLLGFVIGFIPVIWNRNLPSTRCFYDDVVPEGYQMFRFVFIYLVPACVIFTIYGMIYKIVLHQVCYSLKYLQVTVYLNMFLQLRHENLFQQSTCCNRESQIICIHLATKRELKVTLNIFFIVIFFMICWLPLSITKSVEILCASCKISHNMILFGIVFTHFNSAVNPLLYAYHLKDFRHAIINLVKLRRRESSTY